MLTDYQIFLNTLPSISQRDVYNRLLTQLPGWFGFQSFDTRSILNVVLMAYVTTGLEAYNQLYYILPQMRFTTMSDSDQIDLFSQDFFGNSLPRNAGENNDTYKARIAANLFNIKATRQGMINAIFNLTGFVPLVFEPWVASDTGGYGGEDSGTPPNYSMGYGTHGAYGSGSYPYQAFVTVFLKADQSMSSYPGYNLPSGVSPPYDAPVSFAAYSGESTVDNYVSQYGGESLITRYVTDLNVYKVINNTKVFGTIVWVQIQYIYSQ